MGKQKGKLYMTSDEIRDHINDLVDTMRADGVPEEDIQRRIGSHYTKVVIKKYTDEEKEKMWEEIYNTIMNVPGGYWQIVDNMDYMPEFELPRFRCLKSVYKGNLYKETEVIKQ